MVGEATGKLEFLPNPCTTKPCLPGLALAVVSADGVTYFLTRDGKFQMQPAAGMPSPGEKVLAIGDVHEQVDVNARPFKTIDFTSLTRTETK
jgi:hypothetical protein